MLIQGIQFITGIQPVNPVLIDSYEGPYASISEANTSIPEVIRVQTRFVRIIDPINGLGKLYWYKDGVSDSNLVPYNDSVSSEILTSLSSTSPITYDSSKGIIGILQASSGTTGALSSADWNTFNNKVDKISNETIGGNKTFNGITTINNDLNINGNIYQSGATYETHAQQVYTTDDLIILRDGAVSGLPSSGVTGFTAKLYDGVHDGQLVFDNTGTARVGDIGGLQPLATREETPINQTFPYWDAISSKFKTESSPLGIDSNGNLVITGNVYATGSVSAYGSSSGTTGGGGGLIGTVYSYANLTSGSTTYLDNDLTSTFNAYTTYQLTQRIIGLEKGSATISSTYLPLSGGTLTGLLTASSGITVNGALSATTGTFSGLLTVNSGLTVNGTVTATSFVVSGGTSSQFLKADGSTDSNTYLTTSAATSNYLPLSGGTLTGLLTASSGITVNGNIKATGSGSTFGGLTVTGNNGSNSVPISVDSNGNLVITGNVYATGSVSAYGSSSGATGGGGGLISNVYSYANLTSGSTTYSDSDLTSTFNAYTINKINNDLSNQIANLETETNSFISDKNFVYTQNIPSSTWTILHNLNKYPSVSVVDSANTVVEGGITYVDLNTLTISFSAQFTGTAYLN